jgi:secreted Zn-dependent insulinase-like peptidase
MVLGKLKKRMKKLSLNSDNYTDDSCSLCSSDCGSDSGSEKVPKDPRDRIVQKPKESLSHYRVLTLKNGMQCLLISDAEEAKSESAAYRALEVSTTDKAAVCLTVRVGSAQEPRSLPGM